MSFFKMFFSPSLNSTLTPRCGFKAIKTGQSDVLFFGGGCNGFCKDVILYNLTKNSYQSFSLENNKDSYEFDTANVIMPEENDDFEGLAAFGMAYLNKNNQILIYGGISAGNFFNNQLYVLQNYGDLKIAQTIGDIPSARFGLTFTKIDENRIVMFGGVENSNKNPYDAVIPRFLNEIYLLHIDKHDVFRWEKIDSIDPEKKQPCPRESHTAVYYQNQLIIFGGLNGTKRLKDIWLLNLTSFKWTECKTVGNVIGRSMHTANLVDDKMYIFGGFIHEDKNEYKTRTTNSVQCFDLKTMKWHSLLMLSPNKPEPRAGHASIEHFGRIYFWSGRDDTNFDSMNEIECHSDVWCFETKKPHQVTNLRLVNYEQNSFAIDWSCTINAVYYVVELKEIGSCQDKYEQVLDINIEKMIVDNDEIEIIEEHPLNIFITKKLAVEDVKREKPKIVILEDKVLSLDEQIDINDLFHKSDFSKFIIEQIDGIALGVSCESSTDSETETFFKENTKHSIARQNTWYLVGIFKESYCRIKSYNVNVLDRFLTSDKIPNLIGSKQIPVVPGGTYSVRVSALNSCGLSDSSNSVYVTTTHNDL